MGQLGAQAVNYHLQSLVASDPKKNNHLLEHCEGLRTYPDKLNFPLQQKLDNTGSSTTANKTHSSASAEVWI